MAGDGVSQREKANKKKRFREIPTFFERLFEVTLMMMMMMMMMMMTTMTMMMIVAKFKKINMT